jgi:hypothetical protein
MVGYRLELHIGFDPFNSANSPTAAMAPSLAKFEKSEDYRIIFIDTDNNYTRHWICIRRDLNEVYYLNSYGVPVDVEFKYLDNRKLKYLGEDKPWFKTLLKN